MKNNKLEDELFGELDFEAQLDKTKQVKSEQTEKTTISKKQHSKAESKDSSDLEKGGSSSSFLSEPINKRNHQQHLGFTRIPIKKIKPEKIKVYDVVFQSPSSSTQVTPTNSSQRAQEIPSPTVFRTAKNAKEIPFPKATSFLKQAHEDDETTPTTPFAHVFDERATSIFTGKPTPQVGMELYPSKPEQRIKTSELSNVEEQLEHSLNTFIPSKPSLEKASNNPTLTLQQLKSNYQSQAPFQILRQLDLFSNMSDQALKTLSTQVQETFFQAGRYLLRKGDTGSAMYVLIKGQIEIPLVNEQGKVHTKILDEVEVIGEMALFTGKPRTADVIAKTNCFCLIFKKQLVEQIFHQEPEVARFLTTILGKRLKGTENIQRVGKYEVQKELGKGGMSYVYSSTHPDLKRPIAIKMLSHELAYNKKFIEQFKQEAQLLAKLEHPHIIRIFDLEEAYATVFLIMEKLPGQTLKQKIKEQGFYSPNETRKIIKQLLSALDLAHQHGIVHRDLKPSNIMFTQKGTIKLMDFGIAIQKKPTTEQQSVQGTPSFMAPEQILNQMQDARTDIYSLAVIAYQMLTGQAPYSGSLDNILYGHLVEPFPDPSKLAPNLPQDLLQFIQKASAKEPIRRFQSCKEIQEFFRNSKDQLKPPKFQLRTIALCAPIEQKELLLTIFENCQSQLKGKEDILLKSSQEKLCHPQTISLKELHILHLTFAYLPNQSKIVEKLIEYCTQEVKALPK